MQIHTSALTRHPAGFVASFLIHAPPSAPARAVPLGLNDAKVTRHHTVNGHYISTGCFDLSGIEGATDAANKSAATRGVFFDAVIISDFSFDGTCIELAGVAFQCVGLVEACCALA